MSDPGFFARAATSPFLPIVAGLFRGLVAFAGGLGFAWAAGVTGDQITMAATVAVGVGILLWSARQKVAAWRASRVAQVASAVASAEIGVPVTVTVTPAGMPNEAVRVPMAEQLAAPSVPAGTRPSPPLAV